MPEEPTPQPETTAPGIIERLSDNLFEWILGSTITIWLLGFLLGWISSLVGTWVGKPELQLGGQNDVLNTVVVALFGVILGRRIGG